MSLLDEVREKYKIPKVGTDKTDKRALVSNVSSRNGESENFSEGELRVLAGPDWPEISTDPAQLDAFKAAAETVKQPRRGEVPDHYTATTTCKGCGPVPIFPGVPETVEGCPWCFNRVKGLPMPREAQ